jgi:hypothetical protein
MKRALRDDEAFIIAVRKPLERKLVSVHLHSPPAFRGA